ncbi:hypothetical protein CFE70_006911 [Pyrenophora teres f. teres 0-1]|uniref:Uncharacterized protein n=1 Tax=Pyrenophora teres f. teres (strain 0-1) TaxID=861557 RepID=E3RLI0_PYRTT|nr:hypothetical protein PTT_09228 [Pyrenophora teres f. teres 0-1]KAE8828522.1 hypothetical protein HRS9139_07741 [Pyrenophora teres f. teres]CAA9963481.1 hypothetical protein PTMSG1_06849 [Pyrenophora teres f. maculata]KAE8831123.1 hypothetical protein PTNB85_07710 [Pyrenophora teres f. teres]KAE8856877.1 hypothetical protein PTNB29_07944 [Pyrenophora teres f. teres]
MRSFILMALVALFALCAAMPISPAAPRFQKRAEQYRLQGLGEFEIAERLSNSASSAHIDTWRARLNNKLHALFEPLEADEQGLTVEFTIDEMGDFSGDLVPGSLEAPQLLPKPSKEGGFWDRLCAKIHRAESSFGYEGKEREMRRPEGTRDWKMSYGSFRRR